MASKFAQNLTEVLQERAPDLAAVPDPQSVRTIVDESATEARRRTELPDTFVYRVTVLALGLAILAVIVAQLWVTLAKGKVEIPEG